MRKTCPRNERLQIDSEIIALAQKVLSPKTIDFAEKLSDDLVNGQKKKEKAIQIIINLIPKYPKRPLYYARQKIRYLPHWTRDPIRYLGDYIDYLERKSLQKYIGNNYKKGMSPSSIRKKLKPFISKSLLIQLQEYDKLFWTPSKHDFKVDENIRKHRFSTKEVVFCVFITIKLSCKIIQYTNIKIDVDPNTFFDNRKPRDYVIEPD